MPAGAGAGGLAGSASASAGSVEAEDVLGPGDWWVPDGARIVEAPRPERVPVDARLTAALERILGEGEAGLPLLPQVAQRALLKLRDPDLDFGELGELLREDPAMAAEILRVVNSCAYGRLFRTVRLETAFVRLGVDAVRSILLAMSLKGLVIRPGGAVRTLGEELWQRSVLSAALLSELGARLGLSDAESLLVGLLHDIGDLVILQEPHRAQAAGLAVTRPLFACLSADWHERLGACLATRWRLTDPLPQVIGDHHRLPAEGDPLAPQRLMVQFAEAVCALLGYGPPAPYDRLNLPCAQRLGLTDSQETRARLRGLPGRLIEQTGVL